MWTVVFYGKNSLQIKKYIAVLFTLYMIFSGWENGCKNQYPILKRIGCNKIIL